MPLQCVPFSCTLWHMAEQDDVIWSPNPFPFRTVAQPSADGEAMKTWQLHNEWCVKTEWLALDGRLEPVDVSITPAAADSNGEPLAKRALNGDVIRKLPIGEMLAAARIEMAALRKIHHQSEGTGWAGWPDNLFDDEVDIGKSQRGQTLTADDLEHVARVYRRAWLDGLSTNQAVRDEFFLSKDGAAKRIGKARKAGLLDGVGPKR